MLAVAEGAGASIDHIENLSIIDTDQVVKMSNIRWVSVKEELKSVTGDLPILAVYFPDPPPHRGRTGLP